MTPTSLLADAPAKVAIAFLRRMHPEGFWVLTAINVNRQGIATATFTAAEEAQAAEWITGHNGKANVYFSVNQPGRRLNKKAARADIISAQWLHADLDARPGASLQAELARILDLTTTKLPPHVPPPTAIVFSGGGYQVFWRLRSPTSDLMLVEACNRKLAQLLGGDACHNIDRIMRLPGTMNIPDTKKIARGRVPAEAEVYCFEPHEYDLSAFTAAPSVQTPGVSSDIPVPSADVARVSLDELDRWKVPDRVKVIIVQGHHPDEPKAGDNSRSAWVFDAVCQLVRCEVPDEVIFSVLTDPDFGISHHVLEQKGDTARYAMRQIAQAKEATSDYDRTRGKVIRPTIRNVFIALARHGDEFSYDEMAQCERINGQRATDEMINVLWGDMSTREGWTIPEKLLFGAVLYLSQQNRYHPVRDYLNGLTWDGAARVDRWVVAYLGAEDTAYNRAVGRVLLLGAVRRVRDPGCKFDTMVVLEGPQGSGKSSTLRVLAVEPEWFTDHLPLDDGTVRLAEALQGNWLVEASELAGLRRADLAKLKTFLSSQEDKVRLAYAHKVTIMQRQCVIVGTTNDERYLRDETGNRRYLPVKTGRINLAGLRAVRDQLWAEAAHLEAQPGTSVILPLDLWPEAARCQQARMERPPCYDDLEQAFDESDDCWVAVSDVRLQLGIRPSDWHANRDMGRAMHLLGWEKFDKRGGLALIKAYGKGDRTTELSLQDISRTAESPEGDLPF